MKLKYLTLFVALVLGSMAFGQTTDTAPDIKGIRLGMTLEQVHDLVWGKVDNPGYALDVRTGVNKPVADDPSSYWGADLNEYAYYLRLEPTDTTQNVSPTLGGSSADFLFVFRKNVTDKRKSVLYDIQIDFDADKVSGVLSGLTEKYGKTDDVSASVKGNLFGAVKSSYTADWTLSKGQYRMSLESLGDKVGRAKLRLYIQKIMTEVVDLKAKNTAKDI